MTIAIWTLVLACVLGIAAGQVLFKLAATTARPGLIGLVTSPTLIGAVALYGVVTLGWVYALRHVELSRAYPLMALCYVIVPLATSRLFDEVISTRYWIGVAFIMVGIVITARA